jgi:hypothetical protein
MLPKPKGYKTMTPETQDLWRVAHSLGKQFSFLFELAQRDACDEADQIATKVGEQWQAACDRAQRQQDDDEWRAEWRALWNPATE